MELYSVRCAFTRYSHVTSFDDVVHSYAYKRLRHKRIHNYRIHNYRIHNYRIQSSSAFVVWGGGTYTYEYNTNTFIFEYIYLWILWNTLIQWMRTICEYAWMHSMNTLWIHESLNTISPGLHMHMNTTKTWMHPPLYALVCCDFGAECMYYTWIRWIRFVNNSHRIRK